MQMQGAKCLAQEMGVLPHARGRRLCCATFYDSQQAGKEFGIC